MIGVTTMDTRAVWAVHAANSPGFPLEDIARAAGQGHRRTV